MRHEETSALLSAPIDSAFAYLDDFHALSAHMERRSLMMAGSRMRIETDNDGGRAVGSHVRMQGRIFGMDLALEEVVTERDAPRRKAWRTLDAKLLVIGQYELGFELTPRGEKTALRVFIDYELPRAGAARWLGRAFGPTYARWCTARMARDASKRFS